MQSDDRKKRKPASKPVKRRARSQKTTNVRRDSASPAGSSSIRPENMSLTSMLETLKPHDHLCLIYQSREEWRAAVVPFILIGLKRGEKCIYIVDTSTADEIRKYLAEEGIDVASAEKSGQLSILHETEVYTSEGSVGPDEIVDFLASEAEKAIADGYPALRVTGEMTWILRDHPGSEKLLEYEAKLNRDFFPKYPCLAICQYDRWKFDPEIIKGVIMTHPLVVRGNRIYRNFYYITPEEFLNDKRTVKEVQHWLDNIEREQQTEEKYLTVLEEMDEGYYELDLAGNWTFFNDTFCSSLGYTREELTGINYRAVTFEGDADTLYKIFEEAYRTGKVAKDINFRVVCKDGSIRSIEASALPVRNAEGNIIGFRGIGRDITERKKAEEALANEAVRRRVLMDESSDGIVVLDEKGKVYDVNRRFAEMLGYSIEEARELHVWDWDTQWPREQLLEMVRTVDEAGDHFETYHRRKDGTVFDVEISTNGAMIAEQKLVFCVCRDVTGRKRAEEALRESEERYRFLVELSPEAIFVSSEGKHVFVNSAGVKLLGASSPDQIIGRRVTDFVHPDYREIVTKRMRKAMKTEIALPVLEEKFIRLDGAVIDVELRAAPLLYHGKMAMQAVVSDITERKKAEEALADEATRRRVLMDKSSDGIVVLDGNGKVYEANQRFAEMLGYSIEEARELHVWDWDTQWPREQLLEMVRTVDEAGDHFETYHRRKDGTVFDVEISTNGAMIAEQKLVFCVCRDVTGRKRAEEALRDREARFRYLFEHSQVANALVGLDGKIIDVNQSAAELYGYDKSEIVGMDLLEFIAPESRAKVTEAFASGLVHASAVPVEVEVAAKGGKRTFFFPGGYHMLFEGDKETGFLISAIDVTERKQVEERMRHLNLVLRAIRNVNQLIARGADRDSLLKGVCENFVNTRGYHNAWIALPDESGKLVIAAEAGMGENFLQVIEQLKRGELPDCGWKALKKTGIVVIEDPLSECTDCPLAKAYSGRGGMSIRLEYAGKVYGMMAVSTPLGFLGHKEEHDLFEEVAGDIAFALHSMEQEEERSGAEEALRDSEERYRRLIETAYEGVWVVDDEGRTTFVNSRMAEMLGYTADEMVDKSLFLFMDEEWKAVAEKKLGRRRMGIVEQYEFKFHRKDGSELWTTIAASPISDKDGRYAGSLMMVTDVTEHKRADEALAEEAIRRRVLMERSRDGISVLDENSELVEANQRFAEMMGYTPEELKGLHSWDWDTQWTREELLEMGRNVDEAGAHLETRHRRKDGTVFDVEISVNSAVVAGKKLLFCVSRDITERKRAEEALRRSEQNFRDSMENSPLGIRVLGEGGETVYANRALLDMWGYSSVEELEAVPKKQRYAPDSYAAHMERSEKRKRGEPAPLSYETGIVRSDGQVRHLSASRGELLWNGEKRFQLVYQDITERKQAELALQKSEQKHHSLVEDTSVGIASIDMAGNLTFVNRAVCNLSGYAESKMLGKSFADFLYPDDVQPVMELFLDAAADQRDSADMEFRVIDRKGRVVHLHASVTRVKQENETVGFNTMMTDITERKQMERELAIRNRISDIFLGFPGDEMYGEVLQVILAVTESKYGIFGYIDEHGTLVAPSMTRDIWEKCQVADRSIRCPRERWGGIWGRALVEKKSLYANKGLHLPEGHIPLKRVLVVPVMYKGEVIGLLEVADCVADYNDDDKRFLEAIADHIAPILHARLWRDREERKRERAEEEYQTIISTSMDGFIVHDMQGNNLDVNEAYCRLIGYSRDELLNMSVSDIEVAEKPEETAEHIQKAKKVGYDRFETRHRRKDGGIVDVDVSVNYLPTDGGRMFVFIRDISERKRIEKELRTSRDYLDRTLNTIVEILMVVDTDYNILDINRSFLEHYGGKRKDIIGRKCYEVLHMLSEPCSAAQRRCPLKIVLNTGKPFHAEHIYEAVEGQKFIFEVSMFPLVDSAGNIEAVVEMQHDITESKRAEEEKGLLEQKAQVASRLASVGEMAAGIAHEINNPLTSVIGYSQLLADRDDIGEDVRMDLKAIDEGAQRVAGIIRRLLTFARQTRPERTLANVNELITNTLDLRDYHLRTNNIKVTTQLATDLPITTADPAQLQQVFLNIIVNAETAMKLARGKGKLLIKTEEVNGTIRISFKDNGPGIARENLERIFDPFFTTREVGEGTGLGLSICHGIIAEHKGRMWVESEKGKGATFIVELPIVVEPTRLEMVEPAGEKPPKAPRAKILVVDDEPSTLDFLSRLLTNEGHGVDTVSNAAEAFEMVKNKRYSLILLDIKMPGASGIELYGRMQKIAQSFAERVIFITGDIMGTDTEAFLSRTKAPYLTKPFDVNQLKKKIEHFLTGGQ